MGNFKLGPIQILSSLSLILGLVLMLTASLFVDVLAAIQNCGATNACTLVAWAEAAGSFGILASIVQVASYGLAWLEKWRLWLIAHLVVFAFTLVAYSIAINKQTNGLWGYGDAASLSGRSKSFMTFAAIDMTYSILAVGGVYYLKEMQ